MIAKYISAEGEIKWINTESWHRVKTNVGCIAGFPNTIGRVIERSHFILFEDERDVTMFKLSLQ